jgi:hypothetical protein
MNYLQDSEQVLRSRLDFTHILKDEEDRQRWSDSIVRLAREMALQSYRQGLRDARPGRVAWGAAAGRLSYRAAAR